MFYLVCYDIVNDRRRTKISHLLEAYGLRVQKSVFECVLDDKQYEALLKRLTRLLDKKEDQLRFYPLTESCRSKSVILGSRPNLAVDDSVFIV